MNKHFTILIAAALSTAALSFTSFAATETAADVLEKLTTEKTTQYFTEDAVAEEDITAILSAGINAESGMNSQGWHFSAVTSQTLLEEIDEEMAANRPAGAATMTKAGIADAPLAIIVSCTENNDFDAGLATQNMAAAALCLDYGVKIISSPAPVLNGDRADYYKEQLSIPDNMQAVAVLLVGTPADTTTLSYDVITGASERNAFDEMATLISE